jgi:hypothetical protein
MSHLTLEELARIVDESPGAREAEHLAACEICRTGLDAMREDVQALGMLPDMVAAPDAWDALEQRLGAEGLIRRRTPVGAYRYARLAAAVVLFLGGTLAGRMTVGHPDLPAQADTGSGAPFAGAQLAGTQLAGAPAGGAAAGGVPFAPPHTDPAAGAAGPGAGPADAALPRGAVHGAAGDVARSPAESRTRAPASARQGAVTFASSGGGRTAQPGTVEEAAALLRQTEELYLDALTRYAELAMQADTGDPIARLAGLQSIVMTTQAALNQAPSDPVINGYHLTALAQRDAALRQVAAVTGNRWY